MPFQFVTVMLSGSKSEAQWRASLRDYALPRLGSKPVDQITTSDVLAVLVPIQLHARGLPKVKKEVDTR